jgi:DNA-binding transcriptional ArsR family regulator
MVNYSSPRLDYTFSALADPTRRAILKQLALGESRVTELAKPFKISLAAVSKHLRVLEEAGLLRRKKEGRIQLCRLVNDPMKDAADWINEYRQFWAKHLDALEDYLDKSK